MVFSSLVPLTQENNMSEFNNYSVLLTVYHKEKGEYFRQALNSIIAQTKPTNDFVIVCDGPLTPELDNIINEYSTKYSYINVIRLMENRGSGFASQAGLKHIKNEILAKMDSDDISMPNRMEKELDMINRGFDVVGGSIAEFEQDPSAITSIKTLPEKQKAIIAFSKKRNPVCNVTVMYKKSQIEAVGGYADLVILEDYTLIVKLLQYGAKVINLPDILVKVRANREQIIRRTNQTLIRNLKQLRKYMLTTKYINRFEYHLYNFQSYLFLITPIFIKRFLYKNLLRKKA